MTHHKYRQAAQLPQSGRHLEVVEIAGNLCAHHGIQFTGLDACEREGARFGNAHLAIAVDHQAQVGVDAAPHAQLHLVTRAQHIVAGHRYILRRREQTAIEQVVAMQGQTLAGGLFSKNLKLGFLQRWQHGPKGGHETAVALWRDGACQARGLGLRVVQLGRTWQLKTTWGAR